VRYRTRPIHHEAVGIRRAAGRSKLRMACTVIYAAHGATRHAEAIYRYLDLGQFTDGDTAVARHRLARQPSLDHKGVREGCAA